MKSINMNDLVKVRLTEKGLDYLCRKHSDLEREAALHGFEIKSYEPPKKDLEGYSEWKLWVLMGAFGELLKYPQTIAPFEAEIKLIEAN
jgi:hypothetical protein